MRGEAVRRCYGSHGFKVAGITTRTWPFRQSRLATAARSFEKRIRPRVIFFLLRAFLLRARSHPAARYRGPHAPGTEPPIYLPSSPRIFASANPFDSPSQLASINLSLAPRELFTGYFPSSNFSLHPLRFLNINHSPPTINRAKLTC